METVKWTAIVIVFTEFALQVVLPKNSLGFEMMCAMAETFTFHLLMTWHTTRRYAQKKKCYSLSFNPANFQML